VQLLQTFLRETMSNTEKKKPQSCEKALKDLESIVTKMEKGDLPLEDALKQYEKGMSLVQNCQKALSDADQRIKLIMEKNGEITQESFALSESETNYTEN